MTVLVDKLESEYSRLHKKAKFEEDECLALSYRDNKDGFYWAMQIAREYSEWISVDERLPEHDGTYPALADGRFGIAKFDPEYNAWLFKNFEVYELMANVTHWMPIPQPPSEVQNV